MTTLENRPNTVVLVIDAQNGVLAGMHDREAVVGNIALLVERARAAGAPVVWIQDHGDGRAKDSEPWQLAPPLAPVESEPRVDKVYPDSFDDSGLEPVLAALGAGRLVVAGAATDQCIRSTLHGALVRGYDVTLVSDAHTTGDLTAYGAPPAAEIIVHTNLYWTYQTAPGRTAGTATARDVELKS
ncbi:isochorismatase family protein [Streptomyces sp. A7024]|uniref:Isochorismatase family protein n=1 Tax=Streptomyces coryli TaxID=1128680 RepID=A0A6G4UB64_9ACTN|nr:isochorismatase family protein [Streptomyces coryli]NGN69383.1 isochorismatase family protein [Streptomyces coryli]